MFGYLKDTGALERSMSKSLDREDDGFDHIRSGMSSFADAVRFGKDAVVTGAQVYNDIKDAANAIDSTSGSKRTSSQTGVSLNTDSKKPKISTVVQRTPVGFSSLNNLGALEGIGAAATAVLGNKTSPPLSLRLGKQLVGSSSIENFLSLFTQTGTISSSFGGRLQVGQDKRMRVFHCFRHNLHHAPTSEDAEYGLQVNAPYPSAAKILNIQGDITLDTVTVNNSPIVDVVNGGVYFAPYNKPDLEDVSFNLNKFKLGPLSSSNDPQYPDDHGNSTINMPANPTNPSADNPFYKTKLALLNDVNLMHGHQNGTLGKHRAMSAIYQNNIRMANFTDNFDYDSAPYKYDAILKQGTVDYLFMNKGIGPLSVEVVVYRVKQGGVQGVPSKYADLDLVNQLEKPISQGNFNKYMAGFGTDNLAFNGQINGARTETSWYTEPDLPYLPSCREIDQAALAYKEVQRIKVCLQAGERRPFQLKLGGEKYDPSSLVKRHKGGSTSEPDAVPIFDKYSYIVALVVNGMPQTRQLNRQGVATYQSVGDCFGEADFQFTAQYTEQVGAMAYKKCRTKHLFTNGNSPSMSYSLATHNNAQTSSVNKFVSRPIIIVDQGMAVRTGENVSGGGSTVFS